MDDTMEDGQQENIELQEFVNENTNVDLEHEAVYEDFLERLRARDEAVTNVDEHDQIQTNFHETRKTLDINKGRSNESKEFFDKTYTKRTSRGVEVWFDKTRVIFTDENGGIRFDGRSKVKVRKFKEELKGVQQRTYYDRLAKGQVVDELVENTTIANTSFIEDMNAAAGTSENVQIAYDGTRIPDPFTVRECNGVVKFNLQKVIQNERRIGRCAREQIRSLEIERVQWKNIAENGADETRKVLGKKAVEILESNIDQNNLALGEEPVYDAARKALENNDITKLQRFREWAKKNLVGVSAVAISIAGIVTTIVVSMRTVIRQGASATLKFGKAVAKALKAVSPLLAPLGSILTTVITMGARGLTFWRAIFG